MIKFLALLFFAMFAFGAFVGIWGAALLALCMTGFTIYAMRVFKRQDEQWASDPRNAPTPPATLQTLDEAGVECSDPKEPA